MPNPPSPFDKFIDSLLTGLQDAAKDFVKDVNTQAKRNLREMDRVLGGNTYKATPVQDKKRPPGARKKAQDQTQAPPPPGPPPKPQKTLYDALEVSRTASQETISAAFRSLSARFHPDNQKTGNGEKYKAITAAWSVLKDPIKRKEYDRKVGLL